MYQESLGTLKSSNDGKLIYDACSKCFMYIELFNLQRNPAKVVLFYPIVWIRHRECKQLTQGDTVNGRVRI